MTSEINTSDVFYQDGYRLAAELPDKFDKKQLFKAITSMHHAIDLLIGSLVEMASKHGFHVACGKGCEWCCHQAVYANSYEIHYLSEYIKKHLSKEKDHIHQLAQKKNNQVSTWSEQKILQHKSPCALLQKGACMAYEARPMACRIYLSTKLETCLEYFNHPENEKNYPALLDFPLSAGKMMNEGFMAGLREKQVETAEFRIEEGLSVSLGKSFFAPDQFN